MTNSRSDSQAFRCISPQMFLTSSYGWTIVYVYHWTKLTGSTNQPEVELCFIIWQLPLLSRKTWKATLEKQLFYGQVPVCIADSTLDIIYKRLKWWNSDSELFFSINKIFLCTRSRNEAILMYTYLLASYQ